jgi:hypothetical protein
MTVSRQRDGYFSAPLFPQRRFYPRAEVLS